MTAGRIVLHGVAASIMAYGFKGLGKLTIDTWIRTQYGGHFQFLTIQGLALAWFTMVISLFLDLMPSLKSLRILKRALFMVAMPLAVVISSIYWTLLLLFPALILQPDLSGSPSDTPPVFRIPLSTDLALHASPGLTLLLDFVFFEHKYDRNAVRFGAPLVAASSTLWYGWWVERCATYNGTFPYPFLTDNPFEIRVIIYVGAASLAWASFRAINALHPKN